MTEENRGNAAALWLRLAGFAILPIAIQVFQPIIGNQLSLLTPLPLAYGMARRGYAEGTAALGFVTLLTFLLLGPGYGLSFLCLMAPMTYGIGWVVRSRWPLYQSVLLAAGLVVLTTVAGAVIYGLATGTGPAGLFQEMSRESTLLFETARNNMELSPEEQLQFEWAIETTMRVIFGFTLSMVVLLVTFYALVIRQWLQSAGLLAGKRLAPLYQWRLPFPFVGIFVLLASTWLLAEGVVKEAALNGLFPVGALYGIQGVVIMGHLFSKWRVSPFFRVMILVAGIVFYRQVFIILVALLGLFDTWIDFRQRWPLGMAPSPPTT